MKFTCIVIAGLLGTILAAGCVPGGGDPSATYDQRTGRRAAVAAVGAIGGLEAWRNVSTVGATALVTLYDKSGAAHVDRQEHKIHLAAGTIIARGMTGSGSWRAKVHEDGRGEVTLSGAKMDAAARKRLISALSRLIHRVRGPMNLLAGRERARTASQVNVGGQALIRVGVGGDNRRAIAYYFSLDDHLLRMVTEGADSAGKNGTVTQYTYKPVADKLAFPVRIRVVRIGRHLLVGNRPVMEVDFSDVTIN